MKVVTISSVEEIPVASQPKVPSTGTDRNTERFKQIYKNLQSAAGDGNLGLKDDLTSSEASQLMTDLQEMKALLMEELEAESKEVDSDSDAEGSSTVSKYQQMLAKAKAEKA